MGKMEICDVYGVIEYSIKFKDKLNVVRGLSGTGKSFIFHIIEEYCLNNDIPITVLNYKFSNHDVESLVHLCKRTKIVVIDNADLFTNIRNLCSELVRICDQVILSIKDISLLGKKEYGVYGIVYTEDKIVVVRRNEHRIF